MTIAANLADRLRVMPAVVVTGARQTGKSTLAQKLSPGERRFWSLDDLDVVEAARRDPEALVGGAQPVTLDEVQREPDLLHAVKRAIDRRRRPGRFLLTGSANLLLMRRVSESLAGRASYLTLWPMTRREQQGLGRCGLWDELLEARDEDWLDLLAAQAAEPEDWAALALRGGFPTPAVHMTTPHDRAIWFDGYVRTYLERDLQDLSSIAGLPDFRRLMRAACLRLGQLVNQTELGRDVALPQPTVHRYLNLLETSCVKLCVHKPSTALRLTSDERNLGVAAGVRHPPTQHEREMTTTGDGRASGVSREGIFGGGRGAEPANPGSYGMAPSGFRLPEGTRLGPVRLQVADLERSLAFYREVLGMRLLEREPARARLGSQAAEASSAAGASDGRAAAGAVLLELLERRGARPAPRGGRTGLFHFAILLPDRPSLGRFATHARRLGLEVGAADHLVSESLYLHDPDRLGIEVYADRPRSAWRRIGRELVMATDPLDWAGLLETAGDTLWAGPPPGTVIGHLHLHVGDLAAASAFYSETLGFDRTVWRYPGALFFAAGGYHHHLGTNVWAGTDATPPAENEAQLLEWTIELPDAGTLAAASESLERAGFEVGHLRAAGGDDESVTQDPWGTPVRLSFPKLEA